MSIKRGRPEENITPILIYNQHFTDIDGTTYKWVWDKTVNDKGPLCVTIHEPKYDHIDKMLRELDSIDKKYLPKPDVRKQRVTKDDKLRIEELNQKLEHEHYRIFPEDRLKIKKLKKH